MSKRNWWFSLSLVVLVGVSFVSTPVRALPIACVGTVSWMTNCGTVADVVINDGDTQIVTNTKAGFIGTAMYGCTAGVFSAPMNNGPTNTTCVAVTSGGTCAAPNVCQLGGCPAGWQQATGTCNDNQSTCCSIISTNTSSSSGYFNPLKFGTVDEVLAALLSQLRNIIVILSIIFIIIGAVMYILSGGNEGRLSMAKGAITAALIGLAIALAAPSFLKEIAGLLGWTGVNTALSNAQSFTDIAGNVLNFLLSIVGILAIIMLVIGGFMYLTAAGDEGRAETGKRIVTYATIAIAVALSALVLVVQVTKFFA